MGKRRLTSILIACAVLGLGVPPGPAGAGHIIPPSGELIGPITANLVPPTTTYRVVNGDSWDEYYYEVYWDETTAGDPSPAEVWGYDPNPQSCGDFYANAAEPPEPTSGTGDPPEPVYRENSALWDHPNGIGPGFCPHEGTSHPGVVTAEVWESYIPEPPLTEFRTGGAAPRTSGNINDPYFYEPLPNAIYFCEYNGSETGEGPPCEVIQEPLVESCKFHLGRLIIASFTAAVVLQLVGENLLASLGEGTTCTVPWDTLRRISILGSGADNLVTIDWDVLKQAKIGLNLKGGINTLTLLGSPEQDWFGLHGIPPASGFSGGFAFDLDKDNKPEFSAANVEYLNIDLGAGNDTALVFPENLYTHFGNYWWNIDGGPGADKAKMLPSGAGRYNFGTDPGQPSVAMVNLDSNAGDGVDVMGTGVETWFAKGSPMGDIFTGAGGAGTGGAFQFKLNLSGGGGNDKLTGGVKNDKLNGGAGKKDVCKGGKGTDTATGCETRRSIPKPLLP